MKATGAGRAGKKSPSFRPSFWLTGLLFMAISPFLVIDEADAAKITFAPNELTAVVAPGEVVLVPVEVSLADTTATNSYASFSLSRVDGSLDPTWINDQVTVSLNSSYKTRQIPFQVKVPAKAKGGKYTTIFRTVSIRSNEQIAPADLLINVEVSETLACNQVPLFDNITSAEDTINARNNKQVAIELSGVVTVTDGCEINDLWYELIDEYKVLDHAKHDLQIGEDGGFSVAVPMVASRRGNDKDGRLYTVKFMAVNEAGIGASPETTVVVLHDNRKE